MNSPWVSFGKKTYYKNKIQELKRWQKGLDDFKDDPYMFKQERRYEEERWLELQTAFYRKFKFEENIGRYLQAENDADKIVQESEHDSLQDDILMRSAKYKALK